MIIIMIMFCVLVSHISKNKNLFLYSLVKLTKLVLNVCSCFSNAFIYYIFLSQVIYQEGDWNFFVTEVFFFLLLHTLFISLRFKCTRTFPLKCDHFPKSQIPGINHTYICILNTLRYTVKNKFLFFLQKLVFIPTEKISIDYSKY